MKTFGQALGAVFTIFMLATSLSCSEVKFQSKSKGPEASCVGDGCITPHTYSWFEGGYNGSCSLACGGGIETQTVNCQRNDGVTVPDGHCTGTKPPSSRTCNPNPCTSPYEWNMGLWGACSKSCGGGVETRTVFCQRDSGGAAVDDSYCNPPKPAVSRSCNTQACAAVYNWDIGAWGACSKTCGGGTQTRAVVCKAEDGTTVSDTYCTIAKPSTSQACNTHDCTVTYTYDWVAGVWGACSKTCGSGTRTRDVTCQRNDGIYVADSFCAGKSQPPSTEVCNPQACPPVGRDVTTVKTLPLPAVDVVLIIDDSASMAADNAKLAQRMGGFLTDLDTANIDYRVCLTTTDVGFYKGSPIVWGSYSGSTWVSSGTHLMTKATANKSKLFSDTVRYLGAEWSSDEQGIKAMGLMIKDYMGSNCFRSGLNSTLTTILISDENERSVGGNQSWSHAQYQPLTPDNYPDTLISRVKSAFGASKKFIWNSIIVRPGDTACEASQDAQGVPSFFGTLYNELSNKTGGHVGSICSADYTQDLRYIKDRVVKTMPTVLLECVPTNTPVVTISPAFTTTTTIDNNLVRFNPAVPEGRTVTVKYKCPN